MDLSLSGSDAVQQQEYDANDDSGISIAMTRVEEDDSGARGAREIHIDIRTDLLLPSICFHEKVPVENYGNA